MRVVCNTSPLILLAKIHRLDLLFQFYEEVIIPTSVMDEVTAKPSKEAEQIQALVQSQKVRCRQAAKPAVERVPGDLGIGERGVIALALEIPADLVILDDQEGRRVAREKGLSVTGTVGILVEARERGLISSLRHELDCLIEAGMWLREIFYHRILLEFGE